MALTEKILSSRRSIPELPFELSIETIKHDQKLIRGENKKARQEYNKNIHRWSGKQRFNLRRSVSSLTKNDVALSRSIKERVYYNRRGGSEVERIGFSFLREGIHLHKGAGRGQGGYIGSSWIDRFGVKKTRDPKSAGKMGKGNRRPVRWFDIPMDKTIPQLADIVANYSVTLQVDATNLFVDK